MFQDDDRTAHNAFDVRPRQKNTKKISGMMIVQLPQLSTWSLDKKITKKIIRGSSPTAPISLDDEPSQKYFIYYPGQWSYSSYSFSTWRLDKKIFLGDDRAAHIALDVSPRQKKYKINSGIQVVLLPPLSTWGLDEIIKN